MRGAAIRSKVLIRGLLSRLRSGWRRRSAAAIFSEIYHTNFWGSPDSRSGAGSDLVQTAEVRRWLPEIVREIGARSMLDVPCGDFHWMREVELDLDYVGADVVSDLIARNQEVYGGQRRTFVVCDEIRQRPPQADLVFCRDLLVHFSYADISAALRNIVASGATYLLTTTFPGRSNFDIATGQWRPIDLQAQPFGLPAPVELLNEKCTEGGGDWSDKSLGLWRVVDVEAALMQARKP